MKRQTKKIIFNITVITALVCATGWVCSRFIHLGRVEYTNNAQVRQHIIPVNSKIQGFIKKIYFTEYQYVHKNDTLAIIEDAEFRFKLVQAEADYQNALSGEAAASSGIQTTRNNISVSDASIDEARIRLENDKREYFRYKNLLQQNAATRQQYDAVKTVYNSSKARYELLLRQKQTTALTMKEQTRRHEQSQAIVKLSEVAIELAKLNLSYTVILSPCDGITGRKAIQEGQLVQPGQTLVDVVNEQEKWIVANYKETQTAHLQEGLPVEIEVDAVPGVIYKGFVKGISQATGSSFSLIPQDNSSGNFVKVEQRIPVRIEFSHDNRPEDIQRLRSGMNVECTVNY